MKVLVIFKSHTPIPLDPMWDSLAKHCSVTRIPFGKSELGNFSAALGRVDFRGYDRVLVDQNIRLIGSSYPSLKQVPNLVFLEHDACQHHLPESRWCGKYDVVFRDISQVRVLVPNRTTEAAFRKAGLDSAYLPKCYNAARVVCEGLPRDIEFGYIGRTKNRIYRQRRKLLHALQHTVGLQMFKTEDGDYAGYNRLLNRIRFFISADLGFNEYMFKNFEAMAAGCVLVAKRQPQIEQEALGFVDMENVTLYDDLNELLEKIGRLRRDPQFANAIADSGRRLVESRHSMSHRGEELYRLLLPEIRPAAPPSAWEKLCKLKLCRSPVW
jgi:spore maturation protein CgeB